MTNTTWLDRFDAYLTARYPDKLARSRARAVLVLALIGTLITLGVTAIAPFTDGLGSGQPVAVFLTTLISTLAYTFVALLVHLGRLNLAQVLFTLFLYLITGASLSFAGLGNQAMTMLLISLLLASFTFGPRGTLFGILIGLLMTALLGGLALAGTFAGNPNWDLARLPAQMITVVVLLIAAAGILWLFAGNLQASLREARRIGEQLRIIAEIGQTADTMIGQENLPQHLVEMIRERLSFYHVQLFGIDDAGEYAVLIASTGTAGEQLLARGHRLAVGSRSVIGQTTQRGERVYATDTSANPVHRANEFLPATRAELALPLFAEGRVIGALDVQSTQPNAFTEEDIETLEILATQIGAAVRNARLFREMQAGLEENRRLFQQAEAGLEEARRLNRQLTGQAWQEYLTTTWQSAGVHIQGDELRRSSEWTPTLTEAVQREQPVIQEDGQGTVIAVPLDVRGFTVGAVEVTLPPNVSAQEAEEMITAVASRLALALDNDRLFEEAQSLARQEHVINEIGGRLQAVTEVDDMLQMTLTELSSIFGAERASVRLRASALQAAETAEQDG